MNSTTLNCSAFCPTWRFGFSNQTVKCRLPPVLVPRFDLCLGQAERLCDASPICHRQVLLAAELPLEERELCLRESCPPSTGLFRLPGDVLVRRGLGRPAARVRAVRRCDVQGVPVRRRRSQRRSRILLGVVTWETENSYFVFSVRAWGDLHHRVWVSFFVYEIDHKVDFFFFTGGLFLFYILLV